MFFVFDGMEYFGSEVVRACDLLPPDGEDFDTDPDDPPDAEVDY
jgi:hypothetical protein